MATAGAVKKLTARPATTRSLNEIQSQVLKAARGAGWEWGQAEEWGYAAQWLAARCLPIFLADIVQQPAAAPAAVTNPLRADGALPLCPLKTGLCLSDNARRFAGGVDIQNVRAPLWLLPFAARLGTVQVSWNDVKVVISATTLWLPPPRCAALTLAAAAATDVSLIPAPAPIPAGIAAADGGCPQDEEEWRRLAALAHKTLVPATETSRARGAGADAQDDN